jgi:RHS repeat-associated protein
VQTSYDANARPIVQKLVSGSTTYALTQTSYDALGRVDCVATRMDVSSLLSNVCTPSSTSNGYDRIVRTLYDNVGRVSQVKTAYGVTGVEADEATNTYATNGQLATLTDAEGNKTSYVYDGLDRLSQTQFPSATKGAGTSNSSDYEQLSYDANSNVTSRRLRDTHSIAFTYDALNRVTVKSVPASPGGASAYDVYYGYDLGGRLAYARFGSASGSGITLAYDALGRLISESNSMSGSSRTVTSEYDIAGHRTRVYYPAANFPPYGTLTLSYLYAYDTLGRLTAITYPNAGAVAGWSYDDAGRVTAATRFGTAVSTPSYDAVSRLTGLAHDLPGSGADVTFGYSYAPSGQMTQATRTNDAYAWGGHYNFNRSYTSNGLNQYTASGSVTPSYDANGNLTSDGSTSFVYDDENKLVSASGGHSATLSYDPLGRLWQVAAGSATTQFVEDGDRLVMELDGSGNELNAWVHANGADTPVVWFPGTAVGRYLATDHEGSVIATANAAGTATALNAYDEYGIPASGNTGRFGYTGQAWIPELGLWYYKARFYSPTMGRFMQTDPIGYGDGMNWYAYVGGDPVNHADPRGLSCQLWVGNVWDVFDGRGRYLTSELGPTFAIPSGCETGLGGSSGGARSYGPGGGGGATGGMEGSNGAKPDDEIVVTGSRRRKFGVAITVTLIRADVLFAHFLGGSGENICLSTGQFLDIAQHAHPTGLKMPYMNGNYAQHVTFDTFNYRNAFGTSTMYFNSMGTPQGFYDLYDMNPQPWGNRSIAGEALTRLGHTGYSVSAEDYEIGYPCL